MGILEEIRAVDTNPDIFLNLVNDFLRRNAAALTPRSSVGHHRYSPPHARFGNPRGLTSVIEISSAVLSAPPGKDYEELLTSPHGVRLCEIELLPTGQSSYLVRLDPDEYPSVSDQIALMLRQRLNPPAEVPRFQSQSDPPQPAGRSRRRHRLEGETQATMWAKWRKYEDRCREKGKKPTQAEFADTVFHLSEDYFRLRRKEIPGCAVWPPIRPAEEAT